MAAECSAGVIDCSKTKKKAVNLFDRYYLSGEQTYFISAYEIANYCRYKRCIMKQVMLQCFIMFIISVVSHSWSLYVTR